MKIKLCFLILLSLIAAGALAQNEPEQADETEIRIRVLARSYGDSIVLRWAPEEAAVWSIINRYGYNVTRRYVNPDSTYVSELLTPQPLKPLSLEEMMARFEATDTLAAIAAEVLHGTDLAPAPVSEEAVGFAEAIRLEAERQQTRFAFAMMAAEFSPAVANALALRFTDINVQRGRVYDYLVEAAVPATLVEVVPGSAILRCEAALPLNPPAKLDIRQANNERIELIWGRDANTAFFIERSTDNGRTYRQLNHQPYYSTLPDENIGRGSSELEFYNMLLHEFHIFSDTITPGKTYHYRLKGIDAFADTTPVSEAISITPIDVEPPAAPLIRPLETIDNRVVVVRWIKEELESDLAGFLVEQAPEPAGPWKTITEGLLPSHAREYSDTRALERGGGYYRVIAQDQGGNQSASFPAKGTIEDYIAPEAPQNLSGIIYYDGIVELFWDAGQEADLRGYRVYYANQADHEYVLLTPRPIAENYFRDTIPVQSLTPSVFFRISAEDFSGNTSGYSEVLELARPDVVPPARPLVLDARQDVENVFIRWTKSPSVDLLAYRIFRKREDQENWELMRLVEPREVAENLEFSDQPPHSSLPYSYIVEAIDKAGNSSGMSRPVSFRVRGPLLLKVPVELQARFEAQANRVSLNWNYQAADSHYLLLLRGVNTETLTPLTTLESGNTQYVDLNVFRESEMNYAVQLVFSDGRKSEPSPVVKLNIP
jgi:uncharacterized protein